jgi:predicted AAA+ superfamily ATPase
MADKNALKNILKEIILDFQQVTLIPGIPRQLQIKAVPGKTTICIGVRRSGKSTFMTQIMQGLIGQGVARENILSLNLFDDRLHALQHEEAGIILEAYFSLYPEKKHSEKIYCFFDEIQLLPEWEPFIDLRKCYQKKLQHKCAVAHCHGKCFLFLFRNF